ncbi:hypothetical protein BU23DRAFT_561550 [Bimuria novae-zelandiae CBS 107.79]|uniref:Uncharacterized protein n=1 Tax=Bimuria novae-zelandiae CBS 107.79 TaxID=1447943 RepID=A0A6A5UI67_9PLEO|nr:hypothetical protein BU23DRAFT_561550 [Bimuria novae-zelandiae CBS 107.79]
MKATTLLITMFSVVGSSAVACRCTTWNHNHQGYDSYEVTKDCCGKVNGHLYGSNKKNYFECEVGDKAYQFHRCCYRSDSALRGNCKF